MRFLRLGVVAVLFLGAALAAFAPLFSAGFITLDDGLYVHENPMVRRGLTLEGARWAFTAVGYAANWHPLTWLSLMTDVSLFGVRATGHHAVNLLLHLASSLLLLLLFIRLGGRFWPAAATAALFAVHPLHVESVAWIAERKDVLSAMLFMLTLLAWTRYVRGEKRGHDLNSGSMEMRIVSPRTGSTAPAKASLNSQGHDPQFHESGNGVMSRNCRGFDHVSRIFKRIRRNSSGHDPDFRCQIGSCPGIPWYVLSLVLFALGLMAKPMLVTLPFLLLVLDWWPLGRMTDRRRVGGLVLEKIPFFCLSAGSAWLTYLAQQRGGLVAPPEALTPAVRLGNAVLSVGTYLAKTFWPSSLAFWYPHPGRRIAWGLVAFSAVVLAAVTLAVILARRRRPWLLAGWCWFAGMLVPVLGLVQVGAQGMANRYTYLPLVGIFAALAWLAADVVPRRPPWRPLAVVAAVALLAALAARSNVEAGYWRGSEELYRRTLAVTSRNWVTHANLGRFLADAGRFDEAAEQFRAALALRPFPSLQMELADLESRRGRLQEAAGLYAGVLRSAPGFVEARYNLANVLAQTGRSEEAATLYREVLAARPRETAAANNLGAVLMGLGRTAEAEDTFRRAIAANPGNAEALNNLGVVLQGSGREGEAMESYRRALTARPGYLTPMLNLADLLVRGGRREEAASWYELALRQRPGDEALREKLARTRRPPSGSQAP